jgi:hypothetical protein
MANKDHPALQNKGRHHPCPACGQVDDHPRHIFLNSLQTFDDPEVARRHDMVMNPEIHLDCCMCDDAGVTVGPGNEGCRSIVERADGKKGDDLHVFLHENPRKVVQQHTVLGG